MNYQLLQGNCATTLPGLPAESVQTCITSPPYFGLRDYGTGAWEGGDPDCDHLLNADNSKNAATSTLGGSRRNTGNALSGFRSLCGKCGAVRVDEQIGMEETVEQYVNNLVEVFRQVRRVLRPDGTVFLNLGDSYSGSGGGHKPEHANPGLSRSAERGGVPRGQLYGIGGKATQDSQGHGSTSRSPYDGHIDAWSNHIAHTCDRLSHAQARELYSQTQVCMVELRGHLPSVGSLTQQSTWLSSPAIEDRVRSAILSVERLLSSLKSMPVESLPLLQDYFRLSDIASVCLSSLHSLLLCARQYAHMLDAAPEMRHCNQGSVSLFEELAHHIRCIDGYCSIVSSWLNPPQVQPYCTIGLLKPKDLIGVPWMVAFALRADGWYLRQEIIWHKRAPMPESVTDRPTRAHEQMFLLTKSATYFYDADAIREPYQDSSLARIKSGWNGNRERGWPGKTQNNMDRYMGTEQGQAAAQRGANKRSVWSLNPEPTPFAHFATMPSKLVEPCILAGSRPGDLVLDPFAGSGTVGVVALQYHRNFVGCELNPDYVALAHERIGRSQPILPLEGV